MAGPAVAGGTPLRSGRGPEGPGITGMQRAASPVDMASGIGETRAGTEGVDGVADSYFVIGGARVLVPAKDTAEVDVAVRMVIAAIGWTCMAVLAGTGNFVGVLAVRTGELPVGVVPCGAIKNVGGVMTAAAGSNPGPGTPGES